MCNAEEDSIYSYSIVFPMTIGHRTIPALLDTGSSVSLIEKKMCTEKLKKCEKITMRTAGHGQGLVANFYVKQVFVIKSKAYEHCFLVVEETGLPHVKVIVGLDLFVKLKLNIYVDEALSVVLDGNKIPVIANAQPIMVNIVGIEYTKSYVYTKDEVIIPTQTAVRIEALLDNVDNEDYLSDRENTNNLVFITFHEKFQDLEVLAPVKGKTIELWMSDVSPVAIKIPNGSSITTAEFVSEYELTNPTCCAITNLCTPTDIDECDELPINHHNVWGSCSVRLFNSCIKL